MTDLVHTNADLVVAHAGPLTPDEAREAMRVYQEISRALIDPAEDIQTIQTRKGPREFPKRSAFQKLANSYRVSTQILKRELTHDDAGELVRCDAIVRATHPDGRYADGDGACARAEDRFARGADKIDHDLPATAVTRATNRAISNLVAFGAVSAEEAVADGADEGSGGTDRPPDSSLPTWARHVDDVGTVAAQLVAILKTAGDEDAADTTTAIGQAIFDTCDGGIPDCVARVIEHLYSVLIQAPSGPAETTEGTTA